MSNKVIISSFFESRFKRFVKKFLSLEDEVDDLVEQLQENPQMGTSLGAGLYKIRVSSKSKGGGKSGGFRVITYLIVQNSDSIDIHLLTIYDKSEDSSIKKELLLKIVKALFE